MIEKPAKNFKTPNINILQEVVIDERTKIYIPLGADSEEAKKKFLSRLHEKDKPGLAGRGNHKNNKLI